MRCAPVVLLCLAAAGVGTGSAQTAAGAGRGPGVVVASIKPNTNPDDSFRFQNAVGGSVSAQAATLQSLVRFANGVEEMQVAGARGWMTSDRFDVTAKAEGVPGRLPAEQWQCLLRALLADRFRLQAHEEMREMRFYALTVAPGGPKLKSRTEPPAAARPVPAPAMLRTSTTKALASALTSLLKNLVMDETNLTGRYDIVLEFTVGTPWDGIPAFVGTAAFAGMEKQLGLRLEARKAPVKVIVIDRAERPRTS